MNIFKWLKARKQLAIVERFEPMMAVAIRENRAVYITMPDGSRVYYGTAEQIDELTGDDKPRKGDTWCW